MARTVGRRAGAGAGHGEERVASDAPGLCHGHVLRASQASFCAPASGNHPISDARSCGLASRDAASVLRVWGAGAAVCVRVSAPIMALATRSTRRHTPAFLPMLNSHLWCLLASHRVRHSHGSDLLQS